MGRQPAATAANRNLPLAARAAAVSPDGMRIAVALYDGKVCI